MVSNSVKQANVTSVAFENPFHVEDLRIFDDETWHALLEHGPQGFSIELLAQSLYDAPEALIEHIAHNLPDTYRALFLHELSRSMPETEREQARQQVLNSLFWELVYWQKPELYEELTAGERLHPGLFPQLETLLMGKTVLDIGAGSGRATFECLNAGVERIYAVEPSPGLRRILKRKIINHEQRRRIIMRDGRFDALPLDNHSVDITLSCSAFTSSESQGGETGLAEMKRVTRPGGKLLIIWPCAVDRDWLKDHGFQYRALPQHEEMYITFHSMQSAVHCAQLFYGHRPEVTHYLLTMQRPEIPFSVIGMNPPIDYCWLDV